MIHKFEKEKCPKCGKETLNVIETINDGIPVKQECSECHYTKNLSISVSTAASNNYDRFLKYREDKILEIMGDSYKQECIAFDITKVFVQTQKIHIIEVKKPTEKNVPGYDFKINDVYFQVVRTNHHEKVDKSLSMLLEKRLNEKKAKILKLRNNGTIEKNFKCYLYVFDLVITKDTYIYCSSTSIRNGIEEVKKGIDFREERKNIIKIITDFQKDNSNIFYGVLFGSNRRVMCNTQSYKNDEMLNDFFIKEKIDISESILFDDIAHIFDDDNLFEKWKLYIEKNIWVLVETFLFGDTIENFRNILQN